MSVIISAFVSRVDCWFWTLINPLNAKAVTQRCSLFWKFTYIHKKTLAVATLSKKDFSVDAFSQIDFVNGKGPFYFDREKVSVSRWHDYSFETKCSVTFYKQQCNKFGISEIDCKSKQSPFESKLGLCFTHVISWDDRNVRCFFRAMCLS